MSVAATIPDLWPTDFNIGTEPAPSTILRQQGYILGERTKDVVYGEVESSIIGPTRFRHVFRLSAPYLKLRQDVLLVHHDLEPYPAEVSLLGVQVPEHPTRTAGNATQLMASIREMLAAPHIVQLVGSLLAQAREMDDE